MPKIPITRAFDWIAKSLKGDQRVNPLPNGYWNDISPVIDAFGTHKMGDFGQDPSLGYAEVNGALGALEVTHNSPLATGENAPRCRLYLSMEFWHDDIVSRRLRPGRVVPTGAGFPFVAAADDRIVSADERSAIRNLTIGPNMSIGARADGMNGGARLTIRVAFVEFELGEYTIGVS